MTVELFSCIVADPRCPFCSFGEVEFIFACIKVAMLVGLILFGLIADVGGVNGVYTGGKYWLEEPFNNTYNSLSPTSLARFLGFWNVFTQAAFAFGGIEGVALLAGEAYNPRKTMRTAVRTVFYRIGESELWFIVDSGSLD